MGKSLGNTIDPKSLVTKFGSDAVRYYFLKEIEFGRDGDYSEERFINIVNAHLANTIGKGVSLYEHIYYVYFVFPSPKQSEVVYSLLLHCYQETFSTELLVY
jgi:methionyl-tRNA synthetase